MAAQEVIRWRCRTVVHKYADRAAREVGDPYDVVTIEGNLLTFGGASALWDLLTGGGNVTEFDNANAHIGVGNSSTSAAATQTDLQGGSAFRAPMASTYPQHSDDTSEGADEITFRAEFDAADANFSWQEWGIFNADEGGRMLNRRVDSLGTKVNPGVWTLTIVLSLGS